MQSHVSAAFAQLHCPGGVCVVDGYGAQVRVARGQLVISDGIGRYRRQRTFTKALDDLERLVILGHEGMVTFEAMRWMGDAGVSFLQVDRDGAVIATSARSSLDDPRLRRALALAPERESGLAVARHVLAAKIAGQRDVLRRSEFAPGAWEALRPPLELARGAASLRELLAAEAQAAADYWAAWENVELRFAKKDEKRIPAHWRSFRLRSSPLTGSPRVAVNPANAILNYLYALLEAETRIACLACGLDPGLGIFHLDQRARDSLALDLMEAARPAVDAYLLDLIARRTFNRGDFAETRKGSCRVLAPVSHVLAESSPMWAQAIAPVVEETCRILMGTVKTKHAPIPTLLTQSTRRAAQVRGRRPRQKSSPLRAAPDATCPNCGGPLPDTDRAVCDDCLPMRRLETAADLGTAGHAALARLRAEGREPMHRPEARRKIGTANAKRQREVAEWDRTHERPDVEDFKAEILPHLRDLPLTKLEQATGLSKQYCSHVRRGHYVPHPRHWDALRRLVATSE
jgi:CRISPR-associated endonuclease Cas1